MLSLPWWNEQKDVNGNFASYNAHYIHRKSQILPLQKYMKDTMRL